MSTRRQAREQVRRQHQRRKVNDRVRKIEDRRLGRRGFLHHASEIVGSALFRRH